jgi:hypothetical protein
MCCLCEKVFDDMATTVAGTRWKERSWYLAKYQLKTVDYRVAHGYCSDCLKSYRDFLDLPRESRSKKEEKA